jgi:hypothetical protein
MPRLNHRLTLHERLTPSERLLVALMLRLVNPLRQHLQLDPVTDEEIVQLLHHLLHEQE